jgi:hypothetical protein
MKKRLITILLITAFCVGICNTAIAQRLQCGSLKEKQDPHWDLELKSGFISNTFISMFCISRMAY